MGYDQWLEQPYQDMYEYAELAEKAHDIYEEDGYQEDLAKWLSEHEGLTENDFLESSEYETVIERIVDRMNERDYD